MGDSADGEVAERPDMVGGGSLGLSPDPTPPPVEVTVMSDPVASSDDSSETETGTETVAVVATDHTHATTADEPEPPPIAPPSLVLSPATSYVRSTWVGTLPLRASQITEVRPFDDPRPEGLWEGVREVAERLGYGAVPVCSMLIGLGSWSDEMLLKVGLLTATAASLSLTLSEVSFARTAACRGSAGLGRVVGAPGMELGVSDETARLLSRDMKRTPDRERKKAMAANLAALELQRLQRAGGGGMKAMATRSVPALSGAFLPLVPLAIVQHVEAPLSPAAHTALFGSLQLLLLLISMLLSRSPDDPRCGPAIRCFIFSLFATGVSVAAGEVTNTFR